MGSPPSLLAVAANSTIGSGIQKAMTRGLMVRLRANSACGIVVLWSPGAEITVGERNHYE